MVFNTTYRNDSDREMIDDIVGKRFSIIEIMKIGTIGSKRMIIENASETLEKYTNKVSDITYANIELRPKGILVLINKGLQNFTWVIPYYHLAIYKTENFSIHAQGHFIRFRKKVSYKDNKSFIQKIMQKKVEHDSKYSLQRE